MRSEKYNVVKIVLLAVGLCFCLAAQVQAKNAEWKWAMSVRGTDKATSFVQPTSLYIDVEKSRYYVVDCQGGQVVSYDKAGKPLKTFNAQGELVAPYDMVRLADGRLVIAEKGKKGLTLIDMKSKGQLLIPLSYKGRDVVVDRIAYTEGSLYVLDKVRGAVLRLDDNLKVSQVFAAPMGSSGFSDFKVKNGRLWALGVLEKRVYVYGGKAQVLREFDLGQSVSFPVSLALGKNGSLFVLDRHRAQVMVYDGSGRKKSQFFAKGSGRGKLYYPNEILFDPWGRLCIVDEGNGRIEVFEQ